VNKISKKKIKIVGFFIFFRLLFVSHKYIIFFMLCHTTDVKVRYAETDQMGIVYHGNYAQYLEIGRTDWLSALGFFLQEDGTRRAYASSCCFEYKLL
jgi:hypothetical protein